MSERTNSRRWGPACERVDSAELITGPTRRAEVDGVHLDFRHPSIHAHDWEPRPWWHFASDSAGSARLIFPSDSSLGVPDLNGAVRLFPGDRVRMGDVVTEEIGPKFLHPHDRIALAADVLIDRADGGREMSPHRLRFFGVTELRNAPPADAFDRMALRVTAVLGMDKLNDFPLPHFAAQRAGLLQEAAYFLRSAESHFGQLADVMVEDDKDRLAYYSGDDWPLEHLRSLINAAALGGYLLAKSESDGLEQSLVERDRNLALGRAKLKDFDNRRLRAREIWDRHPNRTINWVAQAIARELGKDKASIMASIWTEVPETSPSYAKAVEKVRSGEA